VSLLLWLVSFAGKILLDFLSLALKVFLLGSLVFDLFGFCSVAVWLLIADDK